MRENIAPGSRRFRFLAKVGPHKQVGDKRVVEVSVARGVAAHKDFLVMTACGREVSTTLATRHNDLVRCPNCKAAEEGDDDA